MFKPGDIVEITNSTDGLSTTWHGRKFKVTANTNDYRSDPDSTRLIHDNNRPDNIKNDFWWPTKYLRKVEDNKMLKVREAVQNGVQLFNEKAPPGWFNKVNLDTLDQSSTINCVASQVMNTGYWNAVDQLNVADNAAHYGFNNEGVDYSYRVLTDEWKRVITQLCNGSVCTMPTDVNDVCRENVADLLDDVAHEFRMGRVSLNELNEKLTEIVKHNEIRKTLPEYLS